MDWLQVLTLNSIFTKLNDEKIKNNDDKIDFAILCNIVSISASVWSTLAVTVNFGLYLAITFNTYMVQF